jgi:hypothetical protein
MFRCSTNVFSSQEREAQFLETSVAVLLRTFPLKADRLIRSRVVSDGAVLAVREDHDPGLRRFLMILHFERDGGPT